MPADGLSVFTFADLTTVAGALAAGTFLTTAGHIVVALLPAIARWLTAIQIGVGLSIVLYVVAYFAIAPDANETLALVISWVGCAAAILGISVANRVAILRIAERSAGGRTNPLE